MLVCIHAWIHVCIHASMRQFCKISASDPLTSRFGTAETERKGGAIRRLRHDPQQPPRQNKKLRLAAFKTIRLTPLPPLQRSREPSRCALRDSAGHPSGLAAECSLRRVQEATPVIWAMSNFDIGVRVCHSFGYGNERFAYQRIRKVRPLSR